MNAQSPTAWSVPTIVFHHVSPSIDYYTNTPPETFARQIAWMAREYDFWTVSSALKALANGEDPSGHVVITFDDGYEDNFEFALPILETHSIAATFFVIAEYAGKTNCWNDKCGYVASHMNWTQLKQLTNCGHEIGSHGLSHRLLTGLDAICRNDELQRSKAIISHELKVEVESFAYPYGLTDKELCEIAAQWYTTAFSTVKSACTNWVSDSFALRRLFLPREANRQEVVNLIEEW